MVCAGRSDERNERAMEINAQEYTILHTIFRDKLTFDIVSLFLDKDLKVTSADIESRCKVSGSTAFRRLSELNKARLLTYEWRISNDSPPKAVKVYSMPENIREGLRPLFKGLREALFSMLEKRD